jgi:hypothetical protein
MASKICDRVAVEGSEGYSTAPLCSSDAYLTTPCSAQKLAQALIARFNLYPGVSKKARLLDLVDILVVTCGNTFHWRLVEDGFFQMLISDEKVSLLSIVHVMPPYWLCIGSKRPAVSHRYKGALGHLARESIREGI